MAPALRVLALACALPAAGAVSVAKSAKKVVVRVYGEAGCPYTREYLAGPVKAALADPTTSEMMDFDFSPFGNAFYVTEQCQQTAGLKGSSSGPGCGGGGTYNPNVRECFNKICGAGAANRSEDCFAGALVCQHGIKECTFNRYFACSKRVAADRGLSFRAYMPLVTCMADEYTETPGGDPFMNLLTKCAKAAGLPFNDLISCYGSDAGTRAMVAEAAATPDHPGVPWVTVNGVALDESYEVSGLISAVQSASRGEVPHVISAFSPRSSGAFHLHKPCNVTEAAAWQALQF